MMVKSQIKRREQHGHMDAAHRGNSARDAGYASQAAKLVLVLAILLGGCAMHKALRSEPGLDLSAVKPGAARTDVESILGPPHSQWSTGTGVRYSMYRYDAGKEPSAADAAVVGYFDIVSLGLFEVLDAWKPDAFKFSEAGRKYAFVAVSYDSGDIAIGVFPNVDEFARLPEDGRASAPPSPRPPGATDGK